MTNKKKVDIVIDGRNFTVVGNESEDYIKSLAAYVDSKMKEVTKNNKKLSYSMASILTAFNIADNYYKVSIKLNEIQEQAKQPIEKYDVLKEKLFQAKKSINELEKERLIVRRENEEHKKLIKKQEKALELKENELRENETIIKELQDKLFENQIELIETKKELEETIKDLDKGKSFVNKEENKTK